MLILDVKRATISFPNDLEEVLNRYLRDQTAPPSLTTLVQAALREYLAGRGYFSGDYRPLRITPAQTGSGKSDISIDHDRYFAEQ